METTLVYWGYVGIMEKKMETTTIVYWGYIGIMGYIGVIHGIMEKKVETTVVRHRGPLLHRPRKMQASQHHACLSLITVVSLDL